MRPNSSAPQLPKMMDLRGLQLPARGVQRLNRHRPSWRMSEKKTKSVTHQQPHLLWAFCQALGSTPAWPTYRCWGRWHHEPNCLCGSRTSRICLQTATETYTEARSWRQTDNKQMPFGDSGVSPGSTLPLMTPITLADFLTSAKLKMSIFTSLQKKEELLN